MQVAHGQRLRSSGGLFGGRMTDVSFGDGPV